MAFSNEKKPTLEVSLTHFGVKGMKWGVRKKQEQPLHSSYSKTQYESDRLKVGRGGANRINEKLHAGVDHETALKNEKSSLKKKQRLVAAGALTAYAAIRLAPMFLHALNMGLLQLAGNKITSNGAKAAANIFADSKGIPSYSTVSLDFNSATGIWG